MRDLQKCACNDKETCIHADQKKPGVYIWGFLYENKGNSEKTKSKLCNDHYEKKHDWKILNCKDEEIDKVYKAIKSVKQKPCSHYLFIPYYVGMSVADVFGRLEEHKNFKKGDSTKYVRLHEDYMLCYHKHILHLNSAGDTNPSLPLFPIKRASVNNNFVWSLLAKDGYVHYFNRLSTNYLNKHNKHSIKNEFAFEKENDDYSIKECDKDFTNKIEENDPFKLRIGDNDNFWFTYCELDYKSFTKYLEVFKLPAIKQDIDERKSMAKIKDYKLENLNRDSKRLGEYLFLQYSLGEKNDDEKLKSEIKSFFHQAEAATYFALRGITFSRTHTVEFPECWEIQNNSGFNIFLDSAANKKKKNVITCTPEDEFNWPGYW